MRHIKKEWLIVFGIFLVFIGIRSIHFTDYLNFSADQGEQSLRALELWKNKEVTLIGPRTSLEYEGRFIFFGPLVYYFQLVFLLIGGFDPVKSSFAFMFFSGLGVFLLYKGVKDLISERAGYLAIILYALIPVFIDYTRFLWNPNFQLSLMPILVFLLASFFKQKSFINALILGVVLGAMLQFHYHFLLIILGVIGVIGGIRGVGEVREIRERGRLILGLIGGILLGFSPLILFEIRNNFYNFNTLLLYSTNPKEAGDNINLLNLPRYYYLGIYFFGVILLLKIFRNFLNGIIVGGIFLLLFISAILTYQNKPEGGFGMAKGWNIKDELKVYEIIRAQNLGDYNVVNLHYDTLSRVQRFLHFRDEKYIDFDNFKTERYLFVINKDENYFENPAYEIKYFKPSKEIGRWKVDEEFEVYLLERGS